jgi:hypothetical protein
MIHNSFLLQIRRLEKNWPNSFSAERIKIIWEAVKDLEESWFQKLVTDMIANSRSAPLPVEFIDSAAAYKKKHMISCFPISSDQIHPANNSIFSPEEISEFFKVMRARLDKRVTSAECDVYCEMVSNLVHERSRA